MICTKWIRDKVITRHYVNTKEVKRKPSTHPLFFIFFYRSKWTYIYNYTAYISNLLEKNKTIVTRDFLESIKQPKFLFYILQTNQMFSPDTIQKEKSEFNNKWDSNPVADLLTVTLWKVDYTTSKKRQRHQGPSTCMPKLRIQTFLLPCT